MEQGKKKTYTVKDPARLAVVVAAAVGILLLVLGWVFFLGRVRRQTADLAAYTTLTRTGETVTAVLDLDSPTLGRFTQADRAGLEVFVRVLEKALFP